METTTQLNIRLTPKLREKVEHNAREMDYTPSEYVRFLIQSDALIESGEEIYQRAVRSVRKMRKAGLLRRR
jgi:DNA-binding LacI/PurR family transcriptional regulator